ncbi:hypothetical protein BD410DRAFT_846832, partial [Rickenella mellea]
IDSTNPRAKNSNGGIPAVGLPDDANVEDRGFAGDTAARNGAPTLPADGILVDGKEFDVRANNGSATAVSPPSGVFVNITSSSTVPLGTTGTVARAFVQANADSTPMREETAGSVWGDVQQANAGSTQKLADVERAAALQNDSDKPISTSSSSPAISLPPQHAFVQPSPALPSPTVVPLAIAPTVPRGAINSNDRSSQVEQGDHSGHPSQSGGHLQREDASVDAGRTYLSPQRDQLSDCTPVQSEGEADGDGQRRDGAAVVPEGHSQVRTSLDVGKSADVSGIDSSAAAAQDQLPSDASDPPPATAPSGRSKDRNGGQNAIAPKPSKKVKGGKKIAAPKTAEGATTAAPTASGSTAAAEPERKSSRLAEKRRVGG